jgi:hypothetical protein
MHLQTATCNLRPHFYSKIFFALSLLSVKFWLIFVCYFINNEKSHTHRIIAHSGDGINQLHRYDFQPRVCVYHGHSAGLFTAFLCSGQRLLLGG